MPKEIAEAAENQQRAASANQTPTEFQLLPEAGGRCGRRLGAREKQGGFEAAMRAINPFAGVFLLELKVARAVGTNAFDEHSQQKALERKCALLSRVYRLRSRTNEPEKRG